MDIEYYTFIPCRVRIVSCIYCVVVLYNRDITTRDSCRRGNLMFGDWWIDLRSYQNTATLDNDWNRTLHNLHTQQWRHIARRQTQWFGSSVIWRCLHRTGAAQSACTHTQTQFCASIKTLRCQSILAPKGCRARFAMQCPLLFYFKSVFRKQCWRLPKAQSTNWNRMIENCFSDQLKAYTQPAQRAVR